MLMAEKFLQLKTKN